MKIECLGGCREVGRNAFLLNGKEKILLDYGLIVEGNEIPGPVKKVDSIVLGHAHLDHCLHPDTFVQLSSGEISKIKNVNSGVDVPAVDFDSSMRLDDIPCLQHGKIGYKDKMLKISTRSHSIKVTPEHQFFTLCKTSYDVKMASELNLGDYIAVVNKVDVDGSSQMLPQLNGFPSITNEKLMQLLGYMCGDGDFRKSGFNCTDKNIDNLNFYANIVEECLGLKAHVYLSKRNRLRVYSVNLMKWLKAFASEMLQRSRLRTVPQIICKSTKNEIASFLKGIFDAEGSVKDHSIVLCSSSKELVQQIQILMLRFGISSQIYEMNTSKSTFWGKEAYQLYISNPHSLKIFSSFIGVSDKRKNKKLNEVLLKIGKACAPRIDLIPLEGRIIVELGKKIGLRKIDLRRMGIHYYHYLNGHKLSRKTAKRLVTKLLGIAKEKNKEVYYDLLYLNNVISSNVGWEPVKSVKEEKLDADGVYDLTVPGHSNYIANGIVVHNCGSIPMLYRRFKVPIYSTIATFDQADMLLKDSLKIARIKEFVKHFGQSDIDKMDKSQVRVTYGQRLENENFSMDIFDAGHIPGSIAPLIEIDNKNILYASDFNVNPTRLLNGAKINVKNIDALIIESTYSNRNHSDRKETEKKFFETIEGTIANGGVAVIPSFAVARSAEILMILDSFKADFPIYLDGMSKQATQVALNYPELIRDPNALRKAVEDVKMIYSNDERRKIIKEPCAIVTSSGLLDGGPSVYYIKYLYNNIESSIVFTGFLIPRTAGRYLVDTGRFVTEGIDLKIKMGIHLYDFSVTPETPVLVRDFEKTKLCPIKDVASNFDLDTLECFSFDKKNLKSSWHKVAFIIKHNYSGKIYKITTKTGKNVEITQGHSVFVLRNGKIVDVPGEEVKVGDYIAIPKRISNELIFKKLDLSKHFKYNTSTAPKKISISIKLCRLLGYYVAEGHAIDRVGISLNRCEHEIATEVKEEVNNTFSHLNVVSYYPNPSELQLRFGGTLTARIFEELCGRGAYKKKAPEFLFRCPKEHVLEFIGAYLTGDGWFEGGKIRTKSASKKLIDDLIYLLLQTGIIAKYEGIRIAKERKAPQGILFKESISHSLRIQGLKDLEVIVPFLRGKIRNDVENYLKTAKRIWSVPPHGLPVRELDMKNSLGGYNWRIEKILRSSTRNHINPNLIINEEIKSQFLRDVINGDIAFDIIKKIEESDYNGEVYDLSVPGPQNFLGGFGGIFLHNSAHCGRDDLFDFVNKIKPKKVICIHGDNCERFATELKSRGFDAVAPKMGDVIDVD